MNTLKQIFLKIRYRLVLWFYRNPQYWLRDYSYFKSLKRTDKDLQWKLAPRSPDLRFDGGGAQIGNYLYVLGGFEMLDAVIRNCDVFDLSRKKWIKRFSLPEGASETHHGMVCDGKRYIYQVTGQVGPQCCPAVVSCFSLDTKTYHWSKLPDLPEARYAPNAQLWNGRLHVFGGSKPDRCTPALEHWSLAVSEGRALDDWRQEKPIPRGGPHRASAIFDNHLYLFGGQEGDWVAIPGDPEYRGVGDRIIEELYGDTYRLKSLEEKWEQLASMPIAVSHIEYSIVKIDSKLVIVGGMCHKNTQTMRAELTDAIQVYDTKTDTWKIVGRTPYRIKHTVVGYYDGWLYITTGQRDTSVDDPTAHMITDRTWRAKFSLTD